MAGRGRPPSPPGGPNPVDVQVGRRLRERRGLLGLSQERLGELLGVSFQQVQKYERGVNRVGPSRLYDLCRILDVPADYFFAADPAASPVPSAAAPTIGPGLAEAAPAFAFDDPAAAPSPAAAPQPGEGVDTREALELVRAFNRIEEPAIRRRLLDLAKALADEPGRGTSPYPRWS
jgi:transcriptional regulator with XRE-family HTH domain